LIKALQSIVVLAVIVFFSSGACDPPMRQTPYSITNKSTEDIVFAYYYVTDDLNTEEYLLTSLSEDIEIFNTTGPYYEALKPNKTFLVKSYANREELLEESSRSIFFIWIQETKNLGKVKDVSPITFDDIDFYFIGNAKELEKINWEIVYHGK